MNAEPITVRQAGLSRIAPIAVWIFCVLGTADALIEGTTGFAVRTVLILTAVAYAAWLVLASPHLSVDPGGLTILNPARVVRVPFGALVDVRVGGLASVVARVGVDRLKTVTSWNAPGAPRSRPRRPARGGARGSALTVDPFEVAHRATSQSEVLIAVDRFRTPWEREHPSGDPGATATTTWRWREWVVLAALVVVNVAIRLR